MSYIIICNLSHSFCVSWDLPKKDIVSLFGLHQDIEILGTYLAIKYFRHSLQGRHSAIYIDHKPLTFAYSKQSNSWFPHRLRHLDCTSQFSADIRHIAGKDNIIVDTLSRLNKIQNISTDFITMVAKQATETVVWLADQALFISLIPKNVGMSWSSIILWYSTEKIQPYVPETLRLAVFRNLHSLSHQ